jgi:DNA-binding PadR family transcriptional regulator
MVAVEDSIVDDDQSIVGRLTDLEAHVLSHIVANAPTTAYDIRRTFERSPVSALSGSTGAIYPSVRRLVERGLVCSEPVTPEARSKVLLTPTGSGRAAILRWASTIEPSDLLPHDPLRGKLTQLAGLDKATQIRFLVLARAALDSKLAEVDRHASSSPGVYAEFAYDGARSVLAARRAWLDRVLMVIADL